VRPFKVVILKHGYASTEIERRIVTAAGGELIDTDALPDAQRFAVAEQADALILRWDQVTAPMIARLRQCRIIVRYGVGYDNVDYEAATAAGIIIGHAPNYCQDEVAAHTVALWLACVRGVVTAHEFLAHGGWHDNPVCRLHRLSGQTFGLIGLGGIGRAVARRLAGWGLHLLANDPYVEPTEAAAVGADLVDLATLLRHAHHISLHVPLLPETRHLLASEEFALLKPGAVLVNTARGPLLHTAALVNAVRSGHVSAAGLDVFEAEPLPPDSPLRRQERIILTNHTAWYSEESQAELQRTVAEEAVRVCTGGLPRAIANPEVLHRLGRFAEWTPTENARWRWKRAAAIASRT
jgi:D-3-phosphoglycerate dehydrogenase